MKAIKASITCTGLVVCWISACDLGVNYSADDYDNPEANLRLLDANEMEIPAEIDTVVGSNYTLHVSISGEASRNRRRIALRSVFRPNVNDTTITRSDTLPAGHSMPAEAEDETDDSSVLSPTEEETSTPVFSEGHTPPYRTSFLIGGQASPGVPVVTVSVVDDANKNILARSFIIRYREPTPVEPILMGPTAAAKILVKMDKPSIRSWAY